MWVGPDIKVEEKHIASGGTVCPFCGSSEIEGGPVELDAGYAAQEVVCLKCEREWQDSYILAGFIYHRRDSTDAGNRTPDERSAYDENKEEKAGGISEVTVQSYTMWLTANYQGDDGEEYEIVFTKTCEDNLSYEEKEVVNIEKLGLALPPEHAIWKEIEEKILSVDWEIHQSARKGGRVFTIEIEEGWLDALQGMADAVSGQPAHTPEGALESSIFAQIQEQLPAIR